MWAALFPILKKYVFELLIKKLLGSVVLGGLKGWLIRLVFDLLWKRVILPGLKNVRRGTKKVVDKVIAKKKVEKFKEAEGDKEVDDAFSNLP